MIWAKYGNKALAEKGKQFIDSDWPLFDGRIHYDEDSEPYPFLLVVTPKGTLAAESDAERDREASESAEEVYG